MDLSTLFATEINQIKDAERHMIIGIYKLTKNKTSANKIAMKVYEWANHKECPRDSNGTWSTARHILENYTYPKTWRRKSTHKLILNEHAVRLVKFFVKT